MSVLLPLLLLLAACGDIPQPFRHEGTNLALAPAAARGVEVRPLDESPRSAQLAAAIVRRLLEEEIPASTRAVVPGAWVLSARAEPAAGATVLTWTLARSGGEALGGLEQKVPAGPWARATPKTIDLIAAEVVDKLTGPLHGDGPKTAAGVVAPVIRLLPLTGLPGDGDTALATAMRTMLKRDGLTVVDGEAPADFLLRGQVTLSPGRPGEEMLAVAWTVTSRSGEDLGTSSQQGPVPKGRLAGPWGSLASDIAAGATDGIGQILRAAVTANAGGKGLATPPSR